METKNYSAATRLKYSLFRFLPGRKGLHYQRQFRRVHWRETEAEFQRALQCCTEKSAVDLGANIGSFTAEIASKVAKVYAFEPDPWAFSQLEDRTAGMENVTLKQAAVGRGNGTVSLYRHPALEENKLLSTVSSIVDDSYIVRDKSTKVDVEKIDFVEFLSSTDEQFGILKIDVEGAELEILSALFESGAINRFDYVFCETHEPELPHRLSEFRDLREKAAAYTHPKINLDWH